MEHREVLERLSPFLDDELDPVASREVSLHLETCATCAAAFEQQRGLGESLRSDLEYHRASDLLRARVTRAAQAATSREREHARTGTFSWRWVGAAAAVVAVVSAALWVRALPGGRAEDMLASEAVSSHVRSLMANHLTDVASTDRHTVKPWFAGKLDYSPPVVDLAGAGFPLVGGRLDYVQGKSVAARVYLRNKHTINAFVWPEPGERDGLEPARTQQGYHVIHGEHSGMAYWVVSDLNAEELAGFTRMLLAPAEKPATGQ